MLVKLACCVVATLLLPSLAGCAEIANVLPKKTWHERFNWKAEDFFDDAKVIALCQAIEANDIAEIDKLVAAGADVKAQGKGKMTPLLWSYFDNKVERFKRLLEHGADPNVIVESDFGTRDVVMPGEAVTHMAAETSFPGYFEAVFEHDGDPNLLKTTKSLGKGDSPLFCVIIGSAANKKDKIRVLLDKGADINHVSASGTTPTMLALGWGGGYGLALMLLEAGADHTIYKPMSNSRLVHMALAEKRRSELWTDQQQADYERLLQWLVDKGESIEEATADRARWKSWSHTTGEYRQKMDAEIAAREAREKAAKNGGQNGK